MADKNLKILVVCGGISTEREVSLRSGKAIYDALLRKGYLNSELFDLNRNNIARILESKPDIVFLGLHGKGGEDGSIQGMLELAGIPYTGPGIATSAVCMDKILTKRVLANAGLPTASFVVYRKDECDDRKAVAKALADRLGLPMVLKSPCQGSSIGVVIVHREYEIEPAMEEVFRYGDSLLAEQFLEGTEVTLPIMGNDAPVALPVIEITSEREFYDYTAKYTSGLCHHIIPARIGKDDEESVRILGQKTYRVLNCKGLSRIDFIIDKKYGPMIIEVNTLPGMTDMSLFPDAAGYAGIPYDELVEKFLEYGLTAKHDL
ncbi:MAG: D-alanine--D-alanine ligase [Bacteroidales bacterium]|nr:D-alanine--D-alanine ligase [Candidatus Cacconaster scatequi]